MTTPARLAAALACATALLSAAPAPAVASGTGPDARPKVCLVLSGGGARGAAHIGVLQVLEDLRVPIDCIVGTSMGSIVGAAYATGMSPAEIETTVRDADWDTLLSDAPSRADRSVYSKERERARVGSTEVGLRRTGLVLPQGVLVGNQLQFFLQRVVGRARTDVFDELPVRYRAIATDFETGGMVVMDRGDLATAIRASMSVPGAFAPVERDGRLLVDGGLVRNLPVDVARSLGAEVVIAVNLGTSLLPRSELTSIVAAAEQTLNILTEQNVRTSLGELGPRDVLIAPDLGDIGAGDFRRSGDAVPAGVAAAWRAEERLRALAVDDAEYIRWLAAQRRPAVPDAVDRLRVDASGLKHVNPASVEATFAGVATGGDLARAVNSLFGTDDFERIDAVRSEDADGTTLTLRPVEKSWGPNYLRAGLGMSSDLSGTSDFTVYLDTRATWLNRRGLEWRNRGSVGQLNSLESELRQPLDSAREWYVAPRFEFRLRERDYFLDDDAIATYRSRRTGVALDLGRRFGNFGEAAIGVAVASASDTRRTGQRLIEDRRGRVAAVGGTFVHDRLDSLDFPQSGQLVQADARFARRFAGGGARYDRVGVSVQQAFGSGPASLLLGLRHGNAFGSDLPLYDAFAAGGFLNLSGWQPDEILASRLTIAQAVYRHRVAGGSGLLPGLYLGGSLEGADVGRRLNGEPELTTLGGSLFLSAESLLGPFYLGAGYSEGGRLSLYLYVGRP